MPYQFECERADCEFVVRSNADDEVAKLARAHARVGHRGRFAQVDIERGIERVDAS
ncbi:DUF1059 domain-containing protein [Halomontanus rarus]|uniref:DUF1059 domain-containing protein n=1 Tax=Halomontanus rarus TaxID=3034020 RepID=UPI001A98325A